ncbi:hypothetical protein NYE44_02505 [Paenibacillus sp. FSL L8-0493]|uniref:hypothetical protein n=1 Tax=Paenibacillus sp. FSL L8-0493 TaxID=2975333 RepID=UPI0030FD307B
MMCYVSTGLPKFVQDSSRVCFLNYFVIKVGFLNLPYNLRVQKVSFQNQEGWTLLEEGGTERSDVLREYRTSQVRSRFDVEFAS